MIWWIILAIVALILIWLGMGIYSFYQDERLRIEQATLRSELERVNNDLDIISWTFQIDHHPSQYQILMDTHPDVPELKERRIRILARLNELTELRGGRVS